MKISVQAVPELLIAESNVTAVVVDVLRATSAITTAIENGAVEVLTCREIDEARQLAAKIFPPPLLCGERLCKPIPGFDLGNSPGDYSKQIVAYRTLVMTTTNGTRALAAAKNAKTVLVAAFLNLAAITKKIRHEAKIAIVCAGTDGLETDEDLLFAGALISRLSALEQHIFLDEAANKAIDSWNLFLSEGVSLAEKLSQSRGGRNLVMAGYRADIDACAAIDSVAAVPMMVSRDPLTLK